MSYERKWDLYSFPFFLHVCLHNKRPVGQMWTRKLQWVSRIWASLTWLWFEFCRLELISTTAPAALKNDARFKSGQNWLKKKSSRFVNLNPWHTLYLMYKKMPIFFFSPDSKRKWMTIVTTATRESTNWTKNWLTYWKLRKTESTSCRPYFSQNRNRFEAWWDNLCRSFLTHTGRWVWSTKLNQWARPFHILFLCCILWQ